MSDLPRPTTYLFPPNTPEDVEQDLHVARLEGRELRHSRWHHSSVNSETGYGLNADGVGQVWPRPEGVDPDVTERLISWVIQQQMFVTLAVLEYLEDPTPDHLQHVLTLVTEVNQEARSERRRDPTLSSLLIRSLPATRDQLYELARREHPSRRPEAAVRQTLRNLIKQGRVREDAGGVFNALT